MRTNQNDFKTIKFASLGILLAIIFFAIFFLFPLSIKTQQIANETNIVTHCGLSKNNFVSLFDGNLIYNRMFLFPYNGVEIKSDDYFSLKNGNHSIPKIDGQKTITENLQKYFTAKIVEGTQPVYYSLILNQFRKIKSKYNLDDDEYLQLMVNFVQSMPYNTDKPDVKYPLVTFADGCGDCDDKSLLLLALLSQENYNVSLFSMSISPNGPGHAMAGVASNSSTFTKNGYAMIETTKKDSAIGEFPYYVESDNVLVIRIGNGTKTYETHSSVWIINNSQYRLVKKGNTIISITPYYQDVGFINLIRTQKENFDWQMDCKNGLLPFSICNSVSR